MVNLNRRTIRMTFSARVPVVIEEGKTKPFPQHGAGEKLLPARLPIVLDNVGVCGMKPVQEPIKLGRLKVELVLERRNIGRGHSTDLTIAALSSARSRWPSGVRSFIERPEPYAPNYESATESPSFSAMKTKGFVAYRRKPLPCSSPLSTTLHNSRQLSTVFTSVHTCSKSSKRVGWGIYNLLSSAREIYSCRTHRKNPEPFRVPGFSLPYQNGGTHQRRRAFYPVFGSRNHFFSVARIGPTRSAHRDCNTTSGNERTARRPSIG